MPNTNPAHRPNPADSAGTVDTTNLGAGKWGRTENASAVFPHEGPPEVEAQRAAAYGSRADQAAAVAATAKTIDEDGDGEPDEQSLEELKALAKELNVKGRSKMGKDELAEAVAAAQAEAEAD